MIDFTVDQIFETDPSSLIALATVLVLWDMTWAVNVVSSRHGSKSPRPSVTSRVHGLVCPVASSWSVTTGSPTPPVISRPSSGT